MKILLVNKFLYPRGGDCIYTLNLGRLLCEAGHTVRFYAMDYPENIQDKDKPFFAKEISLSSAGLSGRVEAVNRILWGKGINQGFGRLLDEFEPDIVHLNNIHSYLSPVVAKLAHERGIKVIWTLHDYKLICPSYACLYKGKTCEACFTQKRNVLLRKCMKNNLLASILAWGEAINWNKTKLSEWTDCFICPSRFMAKKMQQGGYPENKLQVIYNFIGEEQVRCILNNPDSEREQAYTYIGRLSEEKGIESLLKIAVRLPYKLYIAGTGPLEDELIRKYAADHIVFLGHLSTESTMELLMKVSFTVVPSVCYENNPLTIIESLCCGTPVLGRNTGGIPELLETNSCNRLYIQDVELPALITEMFDMADSANRNELSAASLHRFSGGQYYQKWLEVVEGE
ncbi:glycosyltransferase [Bacteroides sp. UBA939]|uniref:glycosyltransferase n=1 Tax=Bacteroides sp. UBA939 TaxID=1946092 RepID=UPI0025BB147D|nr:glycosyltransferase [Bacteroides sp. UBA939]